MLIAAVPTMNINRAKGIIASLLQNAPSPDKIIILNNSSNSLDSSKDNVLIANFKQNIGVNAAWNYAMQQAREEEAHLMLLNDDIKIKRNFVGKTLKLLQNNNVAVACPLTTNNLRIFHKEVIEPENISLWYNLMQKREGWAFTISSQALMKVPPIPEELFIFFGDDWIWHHTGQWVQDETNIIYHAVGETMRENPPLRQLLNKERRVWRRLMAKNE